MSTYPTVIETLLASRNVEAQNDVEKDLLRQQVVKKVSDALKKMTASGSVTVTFSDVTWMWTVLKEEAVKLDAMGYHTVVKQESDFKGMDSCLYITVSVSKHNG